MQLIIKSDSRGEKDRWMYLGVLTVWEARGNEILQTGRQALKGETTKIKGSGGADSLASWWRRLRPAPMPVRADLLASTH
jgi:hypothetical protein